MKYLENMTTYLVQCAYQVVEGELLTEYTESHLKISLPLLTNVLHY